MIKDLKDKAINIKGKAYVQVKDRILALASDDNEEPYEIITDYVYFESRRMWVVKATLKLGSRIYTGHGQEIEVTNTANVNYSSALENAETSAVGRACAMAGIGVLDSIASVDEITKAQNRSTPAYTSSAAQKPAATQGYKPLTSQTTNTPISKPVDSAQQILGNCSKCGTPNKVTKLGKPYCGARCYDKPVAATPVVSIDRATGEIVTPTDNITLENLPF